MANFDHVFPIIFLALLVKGVYFDSRLYWTQYQYNGIDPEKETIINETRKTQKNIINGKKYIWCS